MILMKNNLILLLSFLLSVFCYVRAQPSSNQNNPPSQSAGSGTFQLSFVVGVLVLIAFIALSLFLGLYTRFYLRIGAAAAPNRNRQNPTRLMRPGRTSSGIDRTVIESLPFFKFSALKGSRAGLECAVCLSKFEDLEVLRLLPKCKHAFHINCIDQWLENHSSCPLCRQRISVEDLTYSNSLRFLLSRSEVREDSNVELFVQREDSRRHGSSRFTIGSSFRKFEKDVGKEAVLDENENLLHKLNHKIIMSDSKFKNRWSNLSSSDLRFLNSQMLGGVSSNRFSPFDSTMQENSTTQATEEGGIWKINSYPSSNLERNLHLNGKRSMSEIVGHSRIKESSTRNNSFRESSYNSENPTKQERLKRLWSPIARKTIQWYSNRDEMSQHVNYTRESLNV